MKGKNVQLNKVSEAKKSRPQIKAVCAKAIQVCETIVGKCQESLKSEPCLTQEMLSNFREALSFLKEMRKCKLQESEARQKRKESQQPMPQQAFPLISTEELLKLAKALPRVES